MADPKITYAVQPSGALWYWEVMFDGFRIVYGYDRDIVRARARAIIRALEAVEVWQAPTG
jgi:ATP-dependent DNA ligase